MRVSEMVGGGLDFGQDGAAGRAAKNVLKPSPRYPLSKHSCEKHWQRGGACLVNRMSRRTCRYHSHKDSWLNA